MTAVDVMQVLNLTHDVRLISSIEIADRLGITRSEARKRKREIMSARSDTVRTAALRLGLSASEVEAMGAENVLRAAS